MGALVLRRLYNVKRRNSVLSVLLAGILVIGVVIGLGGRARAAACPPQSVDYGTVTTTATVPADATYRIWTRMKVPDASNNTYLIDIDNTNCFNVGGAGVPANAWTWVAHRDGTVASKIDVSLKKGAHTIKFVGNKPNVKVDRLVLAADLACVPTGDGGNCDVPPDAVDPTAQLTAPAANSTVSGTVALTANATDNVGVTRVEFFLNGALVGTDTSAPYSVNLDSKAQPNGTHTLSVRAYDAAQRSGSDSYRITIQNAGDTQAPTVPAGLTATAPESKKVVLKWNASTDNVGVKGYSLTRNGVPLTTVTGVTTYTDTAVLPNTAYEYQVAAYDAANNKSSASAKVSVKTPAMVDVQVPSVPSSLSATGISTTQIDLKWNASTDNVGVAGYDIFRATGNGSSSKIATNVNATSYGDASLAANTSYTYYVVARDSAGNVSPASTKVSAKTLATTKRTVVRGVIRDEHSGKPIKHAVVIIRTNHNTRVYIANHRGEYKINNLKDGQYKLTYRAWGYQSTAATITTNNDTIIKDVTLHKR
jgi:chitodextrinase